MLTSPHASPLMQVSDFAWNSNDDWVAASVAEDNILQVRPWNLLVKFMVRFGLSSIKF